MRSLQNSSNTHSLLDQAYDGHRINLLLNGIIPLIFKYEQESQLLLR